MFVIYEEFYMLSHVSYAYKLVYILSQLDAERC